MSSIIWHKLPGPALVKALILILLLAAVFLALMEVVFPLISPLMPFNDMTVSESGAVTDSPAPVSDAPADAVPIPDPAAVIDPERMNQSPAMG